MFELEEVAGQEAGANSTVIKVVGVGGQFGGAREEEVARQHRGGRKQHHRPEHLDRDQRIEPLNVRSTKLAIS